jgi:hypothetical protein
MKSLCKCGNEIHNKRWVCKECWNEYRREHYHKNKQLKKKPTKEMKVVDIDKFFKTGYKERIKKYINEEVIPELNKVYKKIKQ